MSLHGHNDHYTDSYPIAADVRSDVGQGPLTPAEPHSPGEERLLGWESESERTSGPRLAKQAVQLYSGVYKYTA